MIDDKKGNWIPRLTKEEYITKANSTWKGKYDYSESNFLGVEKHISITCIEHKTVFTQHAGRHLKGAFGCPFCDPKIKSKEVFIHRASQKYNNKFDYSRVVYKGTYTPITVICPEHGEFACLPKRHLQNDYGCRKCGNMKISEARSGKQDSFLEKALKVHGHTYDYSKVNYVGNDTKVEIGCSQHGSFSQLPGNHTNSEQGCPKCPSIISKPHQIIVELLEKDFKLVRGEDFTVNDRTILLDNRELDIYFPKHQIAVEVNGVYWHSYRKNSNSLSLMKKRHVSKLDLSLSKGVRLIQLTDLEVLKQYNLVIELLKNVLQLEGIIKYQARKCSIEAISAEEEKVFLQHNHFQGYVRSDFCIGLRTSDGKLLQIMSFGRPRFSRDSDWELLRLATASGARVVGGSERLFKHFTANYLSQGQSVVSYCDLRLFKGNVYERLGFTFLRRSAPNYSYYFRGSVYAGSRHRFQKHKLQKLLPNFDPQKTEIQNMVEHGYTVLFDCGNGVYKFNKA